MLIRIVIVDNQCIVREGVRRFLLRDPELKVVGEAADAAEAIMRVRLLQPDIVLLDLRPPVAVGLLTITAIQSESPQTEVIVLTDLLEESAVVGAVRAGAVGYLLKDTQAIELRKAIKAVAMGQVQIAPQASVYLLREVRATEHLDPLTAREKDVLDLLAQGYSNKEIVNILHISEDTVKTHVRHVLAKLGVRSRTQATLAAMRLGLVPQPHVT